VRTGRLLESSGSTVRPAVDRVQIQDSVMHMALTDRVLETVRKHRMIPAGGRVLVALSGGSDSVALLHLLRALEAQGEWTVAGVAHLNHALRAAAVVDEAFCRAIAATLDLPFRSRTVDVGDLARQLRTSIEDAGRRARYAFFEETASELDAVAIATGHTRDDQAETFLLRMIRGSGLRGLSAIRPKVGRVIRPLIEVGRTELRDWLAERTITFREDDSNQDPAFARNRVRHELIPFLQNGFSPAIVDVLAREAAIAAQDDDRLQIDAIEIARSVVLVKERGEMVPLRSPAPAADDGFGLADPEPVAAEIEAVEVDAGGLTSLHPALAFRVSRLALSVLAPTRFVGFDHVERLLALCLDPDGHELSLPGQHAVKRGGKIVLRREAFEAFANSFRVPLSIPGEVVLDAQGWAVSATSSAGSDLDFRIWSRHSENRDLTPLSAAVQGAMPPLAVRSRQPGDRFRPFGLGGRRKKLQDFLVDRKVARELRDSLPLVVDRDDRIVWVVGESVAEDFRVTTPSQGVIFLKARRLGGLG
jgi:tRNA(Ile)-lysidine synthase